MEKIDEPLTVVLRRLWSDTLTIEDADPEQVALARREVIADLEREHTTRMAAIDQDKALSRDLDAVIARARAALAAFTPGE